MIRFHSPLRVSLGLILLLPLAATAETLHVFIERELDGAVTRLKDESVENLTEYTTPAADVVYGAIFTGWSISANQGFVSRDHYGRSLDSTVFTVYENTTLTAHYLSVGVDEDKDGLPDGWEIYWFGNLNQTGSSDYDLDGYAEAVEYTRGTNPLLPNRKIKMGIISGEGEVVQYNPYCERRYTIRSEPAELLFSTQTDTVRRGTVVTTPVCNPNLTKFAYWTVNGVRQADSRGRALDQVTFVMGTEDVEVVAVCMDDVNEQKIAYWYGSDVSLDSDTDGDGYTLAVELMRGTNPLLPNRRIKMGIISGEGETQEVNLQIYEQPHGAVIDGSFVEVFTSPILRNAGSSETFGLNLQPVVADVNGDGMFDIVLVYEGGVGVYVNTGTKGNPEFKTASPDLIPSDVDLSMNSTEKLATMQLNVEPTGALSATVWNDTLLVSDEEGHIWYYEGGALQHKVWGGTYAGFAEGLRIAAVDWEDDGDLDCLAGTAEGKLMLLRDPKVGRPTNVRASVGVDNVKLDWDPNAQSRIRGYKVYRADAGKEDFTSLVSPYTPLPTYRDYPPSISDFDYKVSSVSRHYIAGNSTPIESESPATEAIRASLGNVRFFWNDAVAKQGERAEVMLSIENSLNYDVAGKTLVVTFDPAYLMPLKIVKTGLTENVRYEESVADGKWTITLTSGELAAGGGKFLTLFFDTLKAGTTKVCDATITIVARQEPAPYRLGDLTGDGIVDRNDLRELARLKNGAGRKWTADQLKAGDFNGNGLLDNADYQALRDLLKERGLL